MARFKKISYTTRWRQATKPAMPRVRYTRQFLRSEYLAPSLSGRAWRNPSGRFNSGCYSGEGRRFDSCRGLFDN